MSKISFTFKSSKPVERDGVTICDGVDVRTIVSYSIEGLGIDGIFNTATGVCALTYESERGLTIYCEKLVSDKKDFDFTTTRKMNPLIVFPQVFQQTKPEVTNFVLVVTTDEFNDTEYLQKYKCQLSFNGKKIEPGYHYNFSVQVTKMGLIVGDMVIEPWTNSVKSLTATIDGDPDFKPNKTTQDENQ